ncbi:MAG: phosphatidylglycerol lysyltransferase domain-containing protein [Elusimicrobia bacterium]|nr:phosphatidylglycerol lysyltransferase domain-containing protein [Elusimicrobiota bacterium]
MFKKFHPGDYQRLKCYFDGQLYPLCPYSLASMMIWSGCVHEAFYLEKDGVLHLSEVDMDPPRRARLLLPLLLPFRYPTPRELACWAKDLGCAEYHYVPQDYLDMIGLENVSGFFTVTEEAGYGDYIYNASDLAELRGHKYSRKRNLIAQFTKAAGAEVRVSRLAGACLAKCLEVFDTWQASKGAAVLDDIPDCERRAIINGLDNFSGLEMTGVAVEIGGQLAGFAFGSRLSADTYTLNFEKADASVKGLYQFLDREAARTASPGYKFINKENDLGIPGIRKAKESYFPARFVRSYSLSLKS